jgi:hypothetical protein
MRHHIVAAMDAIDADGSPFFWALVSFWGGWLLHWVLHDWAQSVLKRADMAKNTDELPVWPPLSARPIIISPRASDRYTAFHAATTIIIIATIIALIAWDIATITVAGPDTTISRISIRFLTLHPALTIACGALIGHLTWSTSMPTNRPREAVLMVIGLVALAWMDVFHVISPMEPLYPFLLGIPIGHALFGQCLSPASRAVRAIAG